MSLITFQNKSDGDFLTTNDVNQIKSIVNLHYTSFIAPMQSQIGSLYSAGAAENTFTGLNDTPSDFNAGKYLRVNSVGDSIEYADIAGGGGGSTTFTGLSDTPSDFTAGKYLRVNGAGNALEYVDIAGGGGGSEESSYISNGTVSGYYDTNNNFRYNHNIIPETNSNFDLGNAEYKIRHLFLSDNSLWIGDESKISSFDGGLKVRRRDKSKLPSYIAELGGTEQGALAYAETSSIGNLSLADLEGYAKTLDGSADLDKIFASEGSTDFKAEDYITDFNLNTDPRNNYQKILIDDTQEKPLISNPPSLDLVKSNSFEFIVTEAAVMALDNIKLACKLEIDPQIHVYKFSITVSKRGYYKNGNNIQTTSLNLFNSPSSPFKIKLSNESMSPVMYYKFTSKPAATVGGQDGADHLVLDCCLAIDENIPAQGSQIEALVALDTSFTQNAQSTAVLTSAENEEYHLILSDSFDIPELGSSNMYNLSLPNGNYQLNVKGELPLNTVEIIDSSNGQAIQVSDSNITFANTSHPGTGETIKVIHHIDISTAFDGQIGGTLYTDYYYYNNDNDSYASPDM